jgi:voltage-gated potassium channel
MYPDLYTSVELVDPKNVEHCRLAKADEIIVSGELSTNLLVRASLDHGVTQIITELVSSRFGSEIYKTVPPQDCVGRSFLEVLTKLKTDRNIIVLAVESAQQGCFLANPPNSYIINGRDRLIVVGKDRQA